jgi:hypothetical protein
VVQISNASINCAAGEFLVAGELLRLGQEAYIAQGPTQRDWDIVCINGCEILRIQVKAIDWPGQNAVNLKCDSIFDYLIVVLLRTSECSPAYYIFKKSEILEKISKKNEKRKDNRRTLSFPRNDIGKYDEYLRKWWF